ncbi:MAG: response regulator, partial [Geminicoccaceae bacterium]
MVVDDDDVDQKMCARAADRSGLVSSLLMFSESEEALKYCANPANQRPDAVLLDLNMPQINGFEFLERIEAEAP